jgi:hypothetical protein
LADLLQQRYVHFGVGGGHVKAAMAQNQTNLFQGNAMPQHLRSRRMAQQVSPFRRSHDAGAFQGALNDG